MSPWIWMPAVMLALVGCREPRKRVHTKQQQRKIGAAILPEAPTPQIPIGAVLDNKVELIGLDLSKPSVKPGETLVVTWYWRSLAEAPGGWKIFVHFDGTGKRTVHDHHAVGELYPVSRWRKGEVIKDVQKIVVDAAMPHGPARLYVGLFEEEALRERQQNLRMRVLNAAAQKGKVQQDGRLEVATVTIGRGSPPPQHTATQAHEPIAIDGKLDEGAWRSARPSKAFRAPDGSTLPAGQRTTARMLWDADYLYVAFTCPDSDIVSDRVGRDSKIWEQDAVEIYLDPGADGKDYVELQISPTGELFDAHFTTSRQPPWQEAVTRLTMDGFIARVDAKGTVNVRGDADTQWTVEARIPWAQLPGVSGPPTNNQPWGLNLFRVGYAGETFLGAWQPVGGDFHNVMAFGRLKLAQNRRPRTPKPELQPVPAQEPTPEPGLQPAPAPTPAP